jgi:uncharacterized protein (UPF0335 family)
MEHEGSATPPGLSLAWLHGEMVRLRDAIHDMRAKAGTVPSLVKDFDRLEAEVSRLRQEIRDCATDAIGTAAKVDALAEILKDLGALRERVAVVETDVKDIVKIKVAVLGALVTGLVGIILGLKGGH